MPNFQLLTALVISKAEDAWNELVWGYLYGVTTLLVEWHTICTCMQAQPWSSHLMFRLLYYVGKHNL